MTGFDVEPSTLRSAAKKITSSVKGVDDVKVGDLGDTAGDFGHDDAAKAYSELMATWNVALKDPLKKDAEASAKKLETTASNYETAENQNDDAFASPTAGPA